MIDKTDKKSKAGRKPIFPGDRVRIGFRCEKELADALNELITLKKKENNDYTLNEYIVGILKEKVMFDLYKMKNKK